MNTQEIWDLIDSTKENRDNQVDRLISKLADMTDNDIIDYSIHFETCYRETYTSDMWGAAYVIMGCCSDDDFDSFRGWLIAQGQQTYTKALQDPEYLAEYISLSSKKENYAPQLKSMIKAAATAYILKHTNSREYNDEYYNKYLDLMKAAKFNFIYPLIVFDWDEMDDLKHKFPRLWARFGDLT